MRQSQKHNPTYKSSLTVFLPTWSGLPPDMNPPEHRCFARKTSLILHRHPSHACQFLVKMSSHHQELVVVPLLLVEFRLTITRWLQMSMNCSNLLISTSFSWCFALS